MRFAPGLVVERVENRERRRTFLDGKPSDCAGFGVDQRQRRFEEVRDLLFVSRLGLKWNVARKLGHRSLLQDECSGRRQCRPANPVSGRTLKANQSSVEDLVEHLFVLSSNLLRSLHANEVPSDASISEAFRVRNFPALTVLHRRAAPLAARPAFSRANWRHGPARTAPPRPIFPHPPPPETRPSPRRFFRPQQ